MLKLRWKYGWLLNILLQSDYIGWLIVLMKYKFSDCRHCALNIHCMCTVRKRSSRSMAKPGWKGASGKMRNDCASLSVKEHLINSFGVFTRCANISHRCNVIPFVSDTRPGLGSSTSNTNSKLFYGKQQCRRIMEDKEKKEKKNWSSYTHLNRVSSFENSQ